MGDDLNVLEDYIKKGLERGFNLNYIKDILIQHGHNPEKVETAANNVMGLKYPEKLKPHIDEVSGRSGKMPAVTYFLYGVVFILLILVGLFAYGYMSNRSQVMQAKSELEEVQQLGVNIDDLSASVKAQLELVKQKDLTIEEKQKIINEQINTIEEINNKMEIQRQKLRDILLDLMNRMIGRFGE